MRRFPAVAVVVLSVAALVGLAACGQTGSTGADQSASTIGTATTIAPGATGDTGTTAGTRTTGGARTFTLDEFAQFDGKNGNPAYVAVDGLVYDVSASTLWPEGEHPNCNLGASAGRDLSEVMKKAPPTMKAQLEKFPVVGTLE